MSEIYWITRIGVLSDFFSFIWNAGILIFFSIITLLGMEVAEDDKDIRKLKKYAKISFIVVIIGVLGDIFTPSTKEMCAIYGIGGIIDYIKSNDKAKQLPDIVVNALTHYVDNIEKEEKEDKDNNNN